MAVSGSRGGVYNPDGIDLKVIVDHKLSTGAMKDFPGNRPISNEELLGLDVDPLYPAALENVITEKTADNIKAKIICEFAKGPTTPQADRILYKKGTHVIPSFLANSGGVIASYFEQVQNTHNYHWSLEDVHKQLEKEITTACHTVYETHKEEKVHMRLAAHVVAVSRVAGAMKLRRRV